MRGHCRQQKRQGLAGPHIAGEQRAERFGLGQAPGHGGGDRELAFGQAVGQGVCQAFDVVQIQCQRCPWVGRAAMVAQGCGLNGQRRQAPSTFESNMALLRADRSVQGKQQAPDAVKPWRLICRGRLHECIFAHAGLTQDERCAHPHGGLVQQRLRDKSLHFLC